MQGEISWQAELHCRPSLRSAPTSREVQPALTAPEAPHSTASSRPPRSEAKEVMGAPTDIETNQHQYTNLTPCAGQTQHPLLQQRDTT